MAKMQKRKKVQLIGLRDQNILKTLMSYIFKTITFLEERSKQCALKDLGDLRSEMKTTHSKTILKYFFHLSEK